MEPTTSMEIDAGAVFMGGFSGRAVDGSFWSGCSSPSPSGGGGGPACVQSAKKVRSPWVANAVDSSFWSSCRTPSPPCSESGRGRGDPLMESAAWVTWVAGCASPPSSSHLACLQSGAASVARDGEPNAWLSILFPSAPSSPACGQSCVDIDVFSEDARPWVAEILQSVNWNALPPSPQTIQEEREEERAVSSNSSHQPSLNWNALARAQTMLQEEREACKPAAIMSSADDVMATSWPSILSPSHSDRAQIMAVDAGSAMEFDATATTMARSRSIRRKKHLPPLQMPVWDYLM